MIDFHLLNSYVQSENFLNKLNLPLTTKLTISLLGQGEYNQNFLFTHPHTKKKLVLRINTASQMHLENQIVYEFLALKNLFSSKRTPEAYFYDDSKTILPYGILVMEWLPGRPLKYETDLAIAGQILADIHKVPIPENSGLISPTFPLQDIFHECLAMSAKYFSWNNASLATCKLLEKLIFEIGKNHLKSQSSNSRCIVNTELNSGNFLINEEGTSFLIDWEKPLLSEPAQDLAHFLVPTTTFWKTDTILTPAQIVDFIKLYIKALQGYFQTSVILEPLPLFFKVTCLRGITWCAMAMASYSQGEQVLFNPDTYEKIKIYLSEDFLTNILENYVYKDFLNGVLS